MKKGKSLQELAVELDRQNKTKRDFVAETSAISVSTKSPHSNNAAIDVSVGSETFGATEHFHGQLSGYTDVPKKYYDRMLKQAPQLLTANVNHWLQQQPERRLVRTLDGYARALLSERYRPLDNYDLAEVALPALIKTGCRVESCDVTDTNLYIKAVTERIQYDVKVGQTVQAGIVISNSEVGRGTLQVSPLLYTLQCANGMIAADSSLRKYHVGRGTRYDFEGAVEFYRDETRLADDKAFWLKVRDTVESALNQIDFEKLVRKLQMASDDKLTEDPIKVIELSQRRLGVAFNENESASILGHLLAGGDLSRYGLHSAVTRAAQDVPSYERATELERVGGRIIELPRSDWENIAIAA